MAEAKGAMTWAVVPVKRLDGAKLRLAGVLGPKRERFALLLARRTLDVLAAADILQGVIVVSPDPIIGAWARASGTVVIDDGGAPLNDACALGLEAARERGADFCVLLPSDLATLTPAGFARTLSRYRRLRHRHGARCIGLVRCKQGTGTNLIVLDAASEFRPAFGADSFAAHLRAARGQALELTAAQVAFDIDTPEDLRALADSMPLREPQDEFERLIAQFRPATVAPAGDATEVRTLGRCLSGDLAARAARLRDQGHGGLITYSRKVFLPLTQLCRDSCHYCTFAKSPKGLRQPYMPLGQVLSVARAGAAMGCKEALFTLGDRPELRYRVAREWLAGHGFSSTLEYLAGAAAAVRDETGLLPHINAGCMTGPEIAMLRPVCASMGLMLESTAERLCRKGGPHHGSPDKIPAARLATIDEAGRQKVPFTTGILIGIGETRDERIDALVQIRDLHERHGHIQEIIVQNFVPKPGTRMQRAAAPDAEELLWTIAAARVLLGPDMSIQAPPNLSPAPLAALIQAGLNDWGGVSPLTPDFVNPEAPWPHLDDLRAQTAAAGKTLAERLTIYPSYAGRPEEWIDANMRQPVLDLSDGRSLGREEGWRAGRSAELPVGFEASRRGAPSLEICRVVDRVLEHGADRLDAAMLAALFDARGADFRLVCEAADELRAEATGEVATYVVNRNINYTNMCSYRCAFCAFSKGSRRREGADKAYLMDLGEIVDRALEARQQGATEVCLQGGIHPDFTGETYLGIVRALKLADPSMHVHAFSPLEVWHGAHTLGMSLRDYLAMLRAEGLGSLPGTAAEILADDVRKILCPDKLTTHQWLEVVETAHEVGLRTTATIMFGHIDEYRHWAEHLRLIRNVQRRTGGFTEFVPLPFVAHEAPLYKRGRARPGPTLREAILMHAVARMALHPYVPNIQASWVKMGPAAMREALRAGANDLGGTLMNESITRAAGATHGQEMTAARMQDLAHSVGRVPVRRNTLYELYQVGTGGAGCMAPDSPSMHERANRASLSRSSIDDMSVLVANTGMGIREAAGESDASITSASIKPR
jgi:FO synthase